MSDEELRELERRWEATRSEVDGLAYLAAARRLGDPVRLFRVRLATGDLDERGARLAAHCGDRAARLALGLDANATDKKDEARHAITDWFWQLLAAARPETSKLREALSRLSLEELELFQWSYELAMQVITDSWNGPRLPELDLTLSEDSTEDFCAWVVSEGRAVWERALGMTDLADLVREEFILKDHPEIQRQQGRPQWDAEPRWVAGRIHQQRVGDADPSLHLEVWRLSRSYERYLRPRGVLSR